MQVFPAFKAAYAARADWPQACNDVIMGLAELPEGANLGLLYVTDALASDLPSILTYLRERTGIENWCGTGGMGLAVVGANCLGKVSAKELYDEPALAVMVGALPSGSFQVFEAAEVEMEVGNRLIVAGQGAETWLRDNHPFLGIVHGDPRDLSLPHHLASLASGLETFLVGGLTSSSEGMPQIANHLSEGTLSGVFFGEGVSILTGLTQGCTPIGPVREVTDGDGSFIRAIDGRPALEVLKEDIGELLAHDLRRIGGYIYVGFLVEGADSGDYLVRNLLTINIGEGTLEVAEGVERGQSIVICRRDHESARTDLNRLLTDLRARLPRPPKGGVYFSCIGRGRALFGPNSEELELIHQEFGDMPLVGFYAGGEISHDRLYGYSGVLTLFY